MGWVPFGICFVDTWLSSSPRGMVTVVLFLRILAELIFCQGLFFAWITFLFGNLFF